MYLFIQPHKYFWTITTRLVLVQVLEEFSTVGAGG